MKITHNQFVIEVIKTDCGYFATANRIYDRGCSGLCKANAYDAIMDVIPRADDMVSSK